MVLANNFDLPAAENHMSGTLKRGSSCTFFESTISTLPEFVRTSFVGSDRPHCLISLNKFDKNSLAIIKQLMIYNVSSLTQTQKIYFTGTNKRSNFYEH